MTVCNVIILKIYEQTLFLLKLLKTHFPRRSSHGAFPSEMALILVIRS